MIRMTVTLIAAIYITLVVVPGDDTGAGEIDVTASSSRSVEPVGDVEVSRNGGWLSLLMSQAEMGGSGSDITPLSRRQIVTGGSALAADENGDLALRTAAGEMLYIDAVIDPVDLIEPDTAVASVTVAAFADPADIVEVAAVAPATRGVQADDAAQVWRVTGSRVNFRAGPSTNTNILTSLVRGEEVEFLASANGDWAHLRVVSSGIEGYMATDFLEPVN